MKTYSVWKSRDYGLILLRLSYPFEYVAFSHDLGHGPFSHLFDGKFLPSMGVQHFIHEHASIALLDLIIEENGLLPEFSKYNLGLDGTYLLV
jgi:hypothetical protein